ncbi:AraC family transcriptional regulator [Salinisphaera hydrothermalis C41B8]|uniref:AraC family transcriptional regulator n=1 Tax=Salinisphaera hydrothermalis (strain C41B8) TaxID=1304275 RepID=A0A084IHG1_SALHC|nr:AraC family transcriptional regulator [Salinisphaera hydrothermalis C41B8]
MVLDILSDVLDRVHLTGALIFRIDLAGPWCIEANPTFATLAGVLPSGTNQIIAFHAVVAGDCWFRGRKDAWFVAGPGEVVVFPHGGRHRMGDKPTRTAVRFESILETRRLSDLRHERFSTGNQPEITLLCGFLGCDRRAFEPLFASLPMHFCVRLDTVPGSLLDHVADEIVDDAPGAGSVRLRLTELLFIQALRQYVRALPDDADGWLAGVRDPMVGRALHALHRAPEYDWSVTALAEVAASSRSRLAARFRAVLGQAPMHYLARLRMQKAARLLQRRTCNISRIAEEVGYDSPAAFQRAFKRYYGISPGAWRLNGELSSLAKPPSAKPERRNAR